MDGMRRFSFLVAVPLLAPVVLCALLLEPSTALAIGETVTDIRVRDNARTQEDTIRAVAGISLGDELETDTLATVRERLHNSGMFADVNVFWEPHGSGARVVIAVKEKFPWAPLPTFSISPGDISFGAVVVHGNLWGRGKQGAIGGKISTTTSGALIAYRDPSIFGSWLYWQVEGRFQDVQDPEYSMANGRGDIPLRVNLMRSLGFEGELGIFWFRRLRTEFRWHYEKWSYRGAEDGMGLPSSLGPAALGMVDGFAGAGLQFDYRAREHAVMRGNSLAVDIKIGNPTWGADERLDYWKLGANYEHGISFFRKDNLVFRGAFIIGDRMPIWHENWGGGTNLRGFQYRRFRGDTQATIKTEYHFPLFSIAQLDFRALVFHDLYALWWRNLDAQRPDGRMFLTPGVDAFEGFKLTRDLHNGVGAGLRFFLRSVAVPLVGLDWGYGIDDRTWRVVLIVGA
jgi:outer membrane protein assembly factor BamA